MGGGGRLPAGRVGYTGCAKIATGGGTRREIAINYIYWAPVQFPLFGRIYFDGYKIITADFTVLYVLEEAFALLALSSVQTLLSFSSNTRVPLHHLYCVGVS